MCLEHLFNYEFLIMINNCIEINNCQPTAYVAKVYQISLIVQKSKLDIENVCVMISNGN